MTFSRVPGSADQSVDCKSTLETAFRPAAIEVSLSVCARLPTPHAVNCG
jgi:hypothetical protein